jgi:uncharacterized protein YjbI with pentapeptide repeats
MKKNLKSGIISSAVALGLIFGMATPATAVEPCTWPSGGRGVDVSGCNFEGRDLFNSLFDDANFSNTNLSDVRARYSYWVGANLSNADMTESIFYGAYMPNANFTGANLLGANLASSNLNNANFTGANLTGVISGGVTGTPSALPAGWIISGGYLIGPGANLRGANLSGVDLTGADLTGAKLTGVRSGGIIGEPIELPENWGLTGGYLFGPGVDLSGARLDGLSIWGANLTNANLQGASINQTAINNSNITGLRSGGLLGTIQQINGAKVVNGYIVGPNVNLARADLREANLADMNLDNTDLTGADFTNANLERTRMIGAKLVNTNFTFANMTFANLEGTSISFGKFNGASLENANFSSTTILASEFYQTNLSMVNFGNTEFISTRSGDVIGNPAALPVGIQIVEGEITNVFTENLGPIITGTLKTGQTVEATTDSAPEGATVSYQWLRDFEPIQGANTRTYLVTAKDVGKLLTVRSTLAKRDFLSQVESSMALEVTKADIVPGTVNISGVMKPGKVIKAIVRPWVNTVGVKYKYQWFRNGAPIKYATKTTYRLLPVDAKKNISVLVTQNLDGYNQASRLSPSKRVS